MQVGSRVNASRAPEAFVNFSQIFKKGEVQVEHFNSENLAIFMLAGFSGLSLFQRGWLRAREWMQMKTVRSERRF